MTAHRTEATVSSDGSVTVRSVPFRKGEQVEIIILPRMTRTETIERVDLRGSVLRYDDPFEPATDPGDWDAS